MKIYSEFCMPVTPFATNLKIKNQDVGFHMLHTKINVMCSRIFPTNNTLCSTAVKQQSL